MKKSLTLIALLISLCSNAQTIETKSSCDSNADGQVTIADVTNTANKVIGKAATEKQVVTAEDLNALLQKIDARLAAIEAKLGIEGSGESSTDPSLENGHEYVDLGLPSGLKWATMNVGATEVAGSKTNSHTGQLDCYGEYYAWGETSPKDSYGSSSFFDSSCSKYNINGGKTTLDIDDDAARANWGGLWRMPTSAEQDELRANCFWAWTNSYNKSGVAGYIVYKAKSDSDKGIKRYLGSSIPTSSSYSLSDTHIFLPTSGLRDGSNFGAVGSYGYYWSSSLYTSNSYYAYTLCFSSDYVNWCNWGRYSGRSIRPVCP